MKDDLVWTIGVGIWFGGVIAFGLLNYQPLGYLMGLITGIYVCNCFRGWMSYLKKFAV